MVVTSQHGTDTVMGLKFGSSGTVTVTVAVRIPGEAAGSALCGTMSSSGGAVLLLSMKPKMNLVPW